MNLVCEFFVTCDRLSHFCVFSVRQFFIGSYQAHVFSSKYSKNANKKL